MSTVAEPRVGPLVGAQLVVSAALLAWVPVGTATGRPAAMIVAASVAFALVGSLQMQVELRRHSCAVTLVEAVLVVVLLWLPPVEAVMAAAAGEAIACLFKRQPLRQLAFNVSATTSAAAVASVAFGLLTGGSRDLSVLVAGALVAAVCYGALSQLSTSAVLTVVEGRRFRAVFIASLVPAAVATVVSSSIGLVGVVLATVTPVAALLLLPLVAMMVLGTRGLALQRGEQLRFERLYAASSRTAGLKSLPDVLSTLAAEARSLVTGASALCATASPSGPWQGVLVDDGGARPVSGALLKAVLGAANGTEGEVAGEDLVDPLIRALGPVGSLVWVRSESASAGQVLLAVIRSLPTDRAARGRAGVLSAFAGHAVLTIANARLYADVQSALAHQVDLNRQKDDFVAVVSHELRTPLTSMIGSVASLRRMEDRLTPDQRAMLTDIALRQGERLQRLIEELLLLATVESDAPPRVAEGCVDLGSLVGELAAELSSPPGEPLFEVATDMSSDLTVVTDEAKLRQILANLLENARKYAPGRPVVVRARADTGRTIIDVVDHGPGIAPEDRGRVFERFVQLDQTATRAVGGTGLGLYLCRQLARILGGSLMLQDAPGGGCCFTLILPTHVVHLDQDPAPIAAPALAGARPHTGAMP